MINALILLYISICVNDNKYHYNILIDTGCLADHVKKYYNESRYLKKEDAV